MAGVDRVEILEGVDDARNIYNNWAETYDKELLGDGQQYVAPSIASAYLVQHLGLNKLSEAEVLDAGCGTGLVGVCLAKRGVRKIDGVDLSPGMMEVARRTGVYRSLLEVDLTKPLQQRSQSYDAIICVGTLTGGHVGPEALDEFIRAVKKGGIVVATVRQLFWDGDGYKAKVDDLVDSGKAKLLSDEVEDSRRGAGVRAIMLVLQAQ